MSRKFKQILEGKYRNKKKSEVGKSAAYVIIHEICTDKILSPEQKVDVIDRFCHDEFTVQDIANVFRNESLENF